MFIENSTDKRAIVACMQSNEEMYIRCLHNRLCITRVLTNAFILGLVVTGKT